MHVTPIAKKNFLIVILPIPLIDKSLQMPHYCIHSLPVLYLELEVQVSYMLEGQFLAISASGSDAIIPTSCKIYVCLATEVISILNTTHYRVYKIELCVYAIFIKDNKFINTHYLVDSCTGHVNLALNVDEYMGS